VQLLCLGDIAITDKSLLPWGLPGNIRPGKETKVLFNWELPISDRVNPVPRSSGPRLVAHPDSWRVIQQWAPGFAALANNHILDGGEAGLANTLEILNKAGFTTVGAGQSHEEIRKPLLWETTEGRLAILNWVFPETHPDWLSIPGPCCWPGLDQAREAIQEMKRLADWVIVVAHWSDEHFSYPRPADRTVALELARMGLDVIVGHHPHVVRGMETMNFSTVFYSLGNFYFSDIPDGSGGYKNREAPRNREGLGVQISFQRGQNPSCRILSFWRIGKEVILDPHGRAARRMESASRPLRIFQNSRYVEWHSARYARFAKWGYRWHFRLWQLGRRGLIRRALRFLRPQPLILKEFPGKRIGLKERGDDVHH
jgi:hypothetical protein